MIDTNVDPEASRHMSGDAGEKITDIPKYITREEMIKDGKLDIYAFLPMDYKLKDGDECKRFDLYDKVGIILKSMHPFTMKLEALRILANDQDLSQREWRHVMYVIRYVEDILTEIYSEETKSILLARKGYIKYIPIDENGIDLDKLEPFINKSGHVGYFSTYKYFRREYKLEPYEAGLLHGFDFTMIYKDMDYRENTPINFCATWFRDRFEDKFEIYAIHVDEKRGWDRGYQRSVTGYLAKGERYIPPTSPLPPIILGSPTPPLPYWEYLLKN